MDLLNRVTRFLNQVLMGIAGLFLGAMIILTCANIFSRVVWLPIKGTYELMGYFGAAATAFALGYTQIKKGHISVDILVLKFSERTQRILDGINCLCCAIFFSLVSWQIAKYAGTLWRTGEVTETLRIIYFPFTYGVALGCGVLALVFLADLLKTLIRGEDKA